MLIIAYLGYIQPFSVKLVNKIEIFNELTIMTVGYHLILFTEFVPSIEMQYMAGYSVIAITIFNILVNSGIMIWINVAKVIHLIKLLFNYCKKKRRVKYYS